MWSIQLIENTVKINEKTAKELFAINKKLAKTGNEIWYELDDVTYKSCLKFNSDHYEHMDYLANDYNGILKVLLKNKVKGRICFGSLEGDNAGDFWGYEFDGLGKMTKLEGKIVWKKSR
ncbi:MAG: hypothetical protein NTX25_00100 [Proteobacteria bacterium]|nr:hypothetical protein [Pseudomonadota bacterium]